jgi:hypothetical protein
MGVVVPRRSSVRTGPGEWAARAGRAEWDSRDGRETVGGRRLRAPGQARESYGNRNVGEAVIPAVGEPSDVRAGDPSAEPRRAGTRYSTDVACFVSASQGADAAAPAACGWTIIAMHDTQGSWGAFRTEQHEPPSSFSIVVCSAETSPHRGWRRGDSKVRHTSTRSRPANQAIEPLSLPALAWCASARPSKSRPASQGSRVRIASPRPRLMRLQ